MIFLDKSSSSTSLNNQDQTWLRSSPAYIEQLPEVGDTIILPVVPRTSYRDIHAALLTIKRPFPFIYKKFVFSTFSTGQLELTQDELRHISWTFSSEDPWESRVGNRTLSVGDGTRGALSTRQWEDHEERACQCTKRNGTVSSQEVFSPGIDLKVLKESYSKTQASLRIYVYPLTPGGHGNLRDWVASRKTSNGYSGSVFFLRHLVNSPMYTTNMSEADFFLVPTFEYDSNDEVVDFEGLYNEPLKQALRSDLFKKTETQCRSRTSCKNHLVFYHQDQCCDPRIDPELKGKLEDRFVTLTFNGRLDDWGAGHATNFELNKGCHRPEREITIPSAVPKAPAWLHLDELEQLSLEGKPTFYFLGDYKFGKSSLRKGQVLYIHENEDMRKTGKQHFLSSENN